MTQMIPRMHILIARSICNRCKSENPITQATCSHCELMAFAKIVKDTLDIETAGSGAFKDAGKQICRKCSSDRFHMLAFCKICRLYQWGVMVKYCEAPMRHAEALELTETDAKRTVYTRGRKEKRGLEAYDKELPI